MRYDMYSYVVVTGTHPHIPSTIVSFLPDLVISGSGRTKEELHSSEVQGIYIY